MNSTAEIYAILHLVIVIIIIIFFFKQFMGSVCSFY